MRSISRAALFATVGVAIGCGGGGGGSSSTNPVVTFMNGVPDSTALDFRVNQSVTQSSVPYGNVPNQYFSEPVETADFDFEEHAQSVPLWSETHNLSSNASYLAIALGEEGFGTETNKRPQMLFMSLNRTSPNGTKSTIIIVHALNEAAGVPTPPIDFTNPGNNPTFSSLDIAPDSSAILTIDAGNQEFIARQSGTQGSYVDKTFTFQPGKIYVMLVDGIVGSGVAAQQPDIKQIALP